MLRHLADGQGLRVSATRLRPGVEVWESSRDRRPRPAEERRGRGADIADVDGADGVNPLP